jgi:hypothetical protein
MNRKWHAKRAVGTAAVCLVTSGLVTGMAGGANAATKDGVTDYGEFVQWYTPNYTGGCEDDAYGDPVFWDDYLRHCGSGWMGVGQRVANRNAGSYINLDSTYTAVVYTQIWYTGASLSVPPGEGGVYAGVMVDNVESLSWRL